MRALASDFPEAHMKSHTSYCMGLVCLRGGSLRRGAEFIFRRNTAHAQAARGRHKSRPAEETGPYDVASAGRSRSGILWTWVRRAAFLPRRPIAFISRTAASFRFPTRRRRATREVTALSERRPQTASRGWSIASWWWTATASCWRIGRSGTICLRAGAARTTSRSAPTIRKNMCG